MYWKIDASPSIKTSQGTLWRTLVYNDAGVAILRRRLLPDFGHFEHRPEGCGYWCRAVAGQSHSGF